MNQEFKIVHTTADDGEIIYGVQGNDAHGGYFLTIECANRAVAKMLEELLNAGVTGILVQTREGLFR
jgi:hypothetical protein